MFSCNAAETDKTCWIEEPGWKTGTLCHVFVLNIFVIVRTSDSTLDFLGELRVLHGANCDSILTNGVHEEGVSATHLVSV